MSIFRGELSTNVEEAVAEWDGMVATGPCCSACKTGNESGLDSTPARAKGCKNSRNQDESGVMKDNAGLSGPTLGEGRPLSAVCLVDDPRCGNMAKRWTA